LWSTWRDFSSKKTLADGTEKTYFYPGVVSQLVRDGKISSYLSPYHTRHTYITLTAIFLAAVFKRKIGFVTHREVRMPIATATPKAAKHSKIVVRVLASISWVKSASGTTTTISQSKPLPS